jgi:undecaprenyl-diphosphatase
VPSARVFTLIAIGFALVSVAIALIPPARAFVFGKGMRALRQARTGLVEVARRPSRLLLLLTGAFIVTFSYILALTASVQAYGGGLGFPAIAAAFLTGSVIGSAAPTPGGLGGMEAALYAALTVAGLDKGTALSSVFTYRLVTFWLPILPGWLAFHTLRRRGDL